MSVTLNSSEVVRGLRQIRDVLHAAQFKPRTLDDGCATCGHGATVLKECPFCEREGDHSENCPMREALSQIDTLLAWATAQRKAAK